MERTKRNKPSFVERDGPNTMCAEQSIVFKVSGVSQTVRWAAGACWSSHYFCRISLATNRDSRNTLTELTELTNILSTMFATAVFVDYTIMYYVHQSIVNVKAFTTNNKSKDEELLSM